MSGRLISRSALAMSVWLSFGLEASAQDTFSDCPTCPRMVTVDGGTFTMGSPTTERERRKHEGPQPAVNVAAFAIAQTEVTRGQYAAFVSDTKRPQPAGGCFTYGFSSFSDATVVDTSASWRNAGFPQTDEHPVVCVSLQDAKDYAAWLARKTGRQYRLPSEAEWEYAARAGTTSTFFWGNDENEGCTYMNGGDPSLLRALPAIRKEAIEQSLSEGDAGARFTTCDDGSAFTSAVRRYKPNAFGLYDMTGNAWEWVADCWREALPTNGVAYTEASCQFGRTRGGSWDDFPEELRSARRSRLEPAARRNDVGFRVVRPVKGK